MLTVVRAQDNTTAQTWSIGASIDLRIPSKVLESFLQREVADTLYPPINGPIVLTANPSASNHAARKAYVDAQVSGFATQFNALFGRVLIVGEVKEYSGHSLPDYHVWAAGQAISRTTYSALFAATTKSVVLTLVSGTATATVESGDVTGVNGMPICDNLGIIPPGTTVVSGEGTGTLTLSANALSSSTGVQSYICPYGVGDGTTTFNVIDRRGTFALGRDNMGGTAANRVTQAVSGVYSQRLGYIGGDQRLQTHGHSVTQNPHTHTGSTGTEPDHHHRMFDQGGYKVSLPGTSNVRFVDIAINAALAFSLDSDPAGAHSHTLTIAGALADITVSDYSGGSSQNIPPATVVNFIVYTGAL